MTAAQGNEWKEDSSMTDDVISLAKISELTSGLTCRFSIQEKHDLTALNKNRVGRKLKPLQ